MSDDDYLLFEGDDETGWHRRVGVYWPVPLWLHHLLTVVGLLAWLGFCLWFDFSGVLFLLGCWGLLWLRRRDRLGF